MKFLKYLVAACLVVNSVAVVTPAVKVEERADSMITGTTLAKGQAIREDDIPIIMNTEFELMAKGQAIREDDIPIIMNTEFELMAKGQAIREDDIPIIMNTEFELMAKGQAIREDDIPIIMSFELSEDC